MQNSLLIAGIACLIAAIVGGGLKAFGIEFPVLDSLSRQLVLGALGLILFSLSLFIGQGQQVSSAGGADGTQSSLPSARISENLGDNFQIYYTGEDNDVKELAIALIREELEPLAESHGYEAEYIEKAEIRELERIARELRVLQ